MSEHGAEFKCYPISGSHAIVGAPDGPTGIGNDGSGGTAGDPGGGDGHSDTPGGKKRKFMTRHKVNTSFCALEFGFNGI